MWVLQKMNWAFSLNPCQRQWWPEALCFVIFRGLAWPILLNVPDKHLEGISFLQNCHKHPLQLGVELTRFCQSKVKGQSLSELKSNPFLSTQYLRKTWGEFNYVWTHSHPTVSYRATDHFSVHLHLKLMLKTAFCVHGRGNYTAKRRC